MKFFKTVKNRRALYKTLAGLCINLAAGYFGTIIVTANITYEINLSILTSNVLFGIFYVAMSYYFQLKSL